jgi:radial spoke head protein 4A
VPDILADSKIFQWAGIGFGENETLLLARSLKQLAISSGASNIRLWGKIQGTKRDYYIAEGSTDAGQTEEEKPAGFEARGTGVNKYVYWATNSPLEAWTQLPDLAPADLQAAREVKVLFSGDLNRKILTNPFFFKVEKNLLRAQIARISFSTTIVPRGIYKTLDENEKEIEDMPPPEGQPLLLPSTLAMSKVDMWVHHSQNILRCNRITHIDQGEGDETGEVMKKIEAGDPYEKRLKSIALDSKVKGGLPAWSVKYFGDADSFGTVKKPEERVNFGTAVAKSLQWPGAHTFYNSGRWLQIYVGDGLKYEQKTFYPVFPPVIREDPKEKPCYHEVIYFV